MAKAKKKPGERRDRNSLTYLEAKNATCPAHKDREELPDGKGLNLVAYRSGEKSLVHRYAFGGKRFKLTLGPLNVLGEDEGEPEGIPAIGEPMTLAQARVVHQTQRHQLRAGKNPADLLRAERQLGKGAANDEPPAEDPNAFDVVAARFARYYGTSHVTRKGTKVRSSTLRDTVGPLGLIDDGAGGYKVREDDFLCPARAWKRRPIRQIRRMDVVDLMDAIAAARGPHAADNAFAALGLVFNFAAYRELIAVSPLKEGVGVRRKLPPVKRKRTLVDNDREGELRLVWHAAESMGWPYGHLVRLLIVTGCRRDEWAEARWSELRLGGENKTLELAGDRTKNGEAHSVPLSAQALAILTDAQKHRISGSPDWLFTLGTGRAKAPADAPLVPISGFSKYKSQLDQKVRELAQEEAERAGVDIAEYLPAHWRQHDLRRTASTGMAKLGVPQEVIDRVTNHISGPSRQGVSDTYNLNPYTVEMREALARWGDAVERVAAGEPLVQPKVVRIRNRRRGQ